MCKILSYQFHNLIVKLVNAIETQLPKPSDKHLLYLFDTKNLQRDWGREIWSFLLKRRKACRLYNDVGYFGKQNACRCGHSVFKMSCRFLHLVSGSTNKLGFSSGVFTVYVHW
jgi:hypothetical protein